MVKLCLVHSKSLHLYIYFIANLTLRTQWFRDGSWSEGTPLPHTTITGIRSHIMVTISNTEVLVGGGYSVSQYILTFWIYDIVQDTYTQRVYICSLV